MDYLLDWRLVCRGFRDAIDGQVLYHCLRRTRLLGYMGSRHSRAMESLDDDEDYAAIHLLEARFERIETGASASGDDDDDDNDQATGRPIWSGSHAVFRVDDEWYRQFHRVGGAQDRQGNTIDDADARWSRTLDRLELRRPEEGFGTLRWCIRLDHAVLDLDFPAEADRLHFDVRVNLATRCVRVAWRDMLVRFLKTERALRLMLDEVRSLLFLYYIADILLHYYLLYQNPRLDPRIPLPRIIETKSSNYQTRKISYANSSSRNAPTSASPSATQKTASATSAANASPQP